MQRCCRCYKSTQRGWSPSALPPFSPWFQDSAASVPGLRRPLVSLGAPSPLSWQTPWSSLGAPPPDNSSHRKPGATAHSREWGPPTRLASLHLLGNLQRSPNLPVTTGPQGLGGQLTWCKDYCRLHLGPGRPPNTALAFRPGAPGAQAGTHLRVPGIRLGTDGTVWLPTWLFISAQLRLAGLTAQMGSAGRAARGEVATTKRPRYVGSLGGSPLVTDGLLPSAPPLAWSPPPHPSWAVWGCLAP